MSYAQFGTDVAILGRFAPGYVGNYLDIGCNEPVSGSNTYLLYEKGWGGIGVDPLGASLEIAWAQKRPGDIFLGLAVGSAPGEATFHRCTEGTVSSMLASEAELRRQSGFASEPRIVPVVTVRGILEANPRFASCDVLSIDVEGWEREVLLGCPFDEGWRPKVVVLEACRPCSEVPSYEEWEPILVDAGYRFVDQRGVNRIYERR